MKLKTLDDIMDGADIGYKGRLKEAAREWIEAERRKYSGYPWCGTFETKLPNESKYLVWWIKHFFNLE